MKVALLTFHDALNYGAVLQAYATQRAIQDLGAECKVIDYVNEHRRCMYSMSRHAYKEFRNKRIVLLQNFVKFINDNGWGGIEYLYSVPALVGGAVAINAGRGRVHYLAISDYVDSVYAYDYGEDMLKTLKKNECCFSYRDTIFKHMKMIILGASFSFGRVEQKESDNRRKERIELVAKTQDNSGGNFGSVFRQSNKYIMQIIKRLHLGHINGMAYSSKTSNWMINRGFGTYREAYGLINKVIKWHKVFGQEAMPEVVMWE
jgi:UDP-N-acetylmuramate dehydrogenase